MNPAMMMGMMNMPRAQTDVGVTGEKSLVFFPRGSEDAADDDGNEQPHDGWILMEMS